MQSQEAQIRQPAPLDMEKFLQQLNQKLANMKRGNAQQLGVLVQSQSESIGRQHDTLVQEISPLIQEVGRLLNENEALKKQLPTTKTVQNTTTDAARDPPKKEVPTLTTKVDPKAK